MRSPAFSPSPLLTEEESDALHLAIIVRNQQVCIACYRVSLNYEGNTLHLAIIVHNQQVCFSLFCVFMCLLLLCVWERLVLVTYGNTIHLAINRCVFSVFLCSCACYCVFVRLGVVTIVKG